MVRQTFTDQYTNGTLAMPKTPTAAASISEPGPANRRSSRYDTKISHITSDDVSRASHCHQTPQALIAQSGPVTNTITPNTTTSSAAAIAVASAPGVRRARYTALAIPHTNADRNITSADGT